MLIYELKNSINATEESMWMELAQTQLGSGVHPDRAKGHALARAALRDCFLRQGIHLLIPQIILKNFDRLINFDTWTISLSHTKDWGAAIMAPRSDYLSVGIDIESLSRSVKPAITERISHPLDIASKDLERWVIKESAFKALMNTGEFSHPQDFSSIVIGKGEWLHDPSGISGNWNLLEQNNLCLALSWIEK
jgi:hypothetical protein